MKSVNNMFKTTDHEICLQFSISYSCEQEDLIKN